MKNVQLDQENLLCPECGDGGGMHHAVVTVYDRAEDADLVAVTEVDCIGATETRSFIADNAGSGNPSSRRNGLAITFWCEHCSDAETPHARLTIAQHKGQTHMSWQLLGKQIKPDKRALGARAPGYK